MDQVVPISRLRLRLTAVSAAVTVAVAVPVARLRIGLTPLAATTPVPVVIPVHLVSLGLTPMAAASDTPVPVAVPVSRARLGLGPLPAYGQPDPPASQLQMKVPVLGLRPLKISVSVPWLEPNAESQPNGAEPVNLRLGYTTNILLARSGMEQRRQLRTQPRGSISWLAALLEARQAQRMAGFIYQGQAVAHAVPLWPLRRWLTSDVHVGDHTLHLAPSAGVCWFGTAVAIYRSDRLEVRSVSGVSANEIILAQPLMQDWPSGTAVCPVVQGFLRPQQTMRWESLLCASVPLVFDVPSFGPVALTLPVVPTFLDTEVLDVMPNRSGPVDDEFDRRMEVLDSGTGLPWIDPLEPAPGVTRTFRWSAFGAGEIHRLLSFLIARRGCAIPFWAPTWQQDLSLAANKNAGAAEILIENCGYTTGQFARGLGRRHLAVLTRGGSWSYYAVTAAADEGDSERLTISPPAAGAWTVQGTLISFLRFCRLAEDEVELTCHSPEVFEAAIPYCELTQQTPTEEPESDPRARVTQVAVEVIRAGTAE